MANVSPQIFKCVCSMILLYYSSEANNIDIVVIYVYVALWTHYTVPQEVPSVSEFSSFALYGGVVGVKTIG